MFVLVCLVFFIYYKMKFEVRVTSLIEENGNLLVVGFFHCGQHNIHILQCTNIISCILKEKLLCIFHSELK